MTPDEKIKRLSLLVAELARTTRDATLQTEHGDMVKMFPSFEAELTEIANEATNLGAVL